MVFILAIIPGIFLAFDGMVQTQPGVVNTTEQGASYIIFQDDLGNTCAKNGSTSRIDFKSANASAVIQYCVDQYNTNVNMIFIKAGVYDIDSTITVTRPVSIIGEGIGSMWGSLGGAFGTLLRGITNGTDLIRFDPVGLVQTGFNMRDIGLTGVLPSGSTYTGASTGLNITIAAGCSFSNMYIYGFEKYGVELGTTGNAHTISFRDCFIAANGKNSPHYGGVRVVDANCVTIADSRIEWGGSGVIYEQGYDNTVIGGTIEGNNYYGVTTNLSARYTQHLSIENVYFEFNNLAEAPGVCDIALGEGDAYGYFQNLKMASVKTAYAIYTQAWYTTLMDIRTITTPKIFFAGEGRGLISNSFTIDPLCVANLTNVQKIGSHLQKTGYSPMYTNMTYLDVYHGLISSPSVILVSGSTNDTKSLYAVNHNATVVRVYNYGWVAQDCVIYWQMEV